MKNLRTEGRQKKELYNTLLFLEPGNIDFLFFFFTLGILFRPSTAENEEEVVEEVSAKTVSDPTKLSTTFRKQNELQYVNIRRGRVSSTTEAPETNR